MLFILFIFCVSNCIFLDVGVSVPGNDPPMDSLRSATGTQGVVFPQNNPLTSATATTYTQCHGNQRQYFAGQQLPGNNPYFPSETTHRTMTASMDRQAPPVEWPVRPRAMADSLDTPPAYPDYCPRKRPCPRGNDGQDSYVTQSGNRTVMSHRSPESIREGNDLYFPLETTHRTMAHSMGRQAPHIQWPVRPCAVADSLETPSAYPIDTHDSYVTQSGNHTVMSYRSSKSPPENMKPVVGWGRKTFYLLAWDTLVYS